MNDLSLTVNGEKVSSLVEPRTSLADLLREQMNLTGTHLGCEQGVCGACTILVDGVPVRSCISNATACGGAEVRTIEDFDRDPLMMELRQAFNAHHALQCGFCTPGMLIMARDIVSRLHDADEARIRIELAGNLCRCTGYAGIVKAIRSVIVSRQEAVPPSPPASLPLGPAGSGHASAGKALVHVAKNGSTTTNAPEKPLQVKAAATPAPLAGKRAPAVKQTFSVAAPPSAVWERFGDVPSMIRCIPGASLVSQEPDGTYQIKMRVKMGPIGAEFAGVARQERDDDALTGIIHGSGRDARSASLAEGQLTYRLADEDNGESTRVDIEVSYQLSGALAQFARAGIVTHFIGAITTQFAENLSRSLSSGGTEDEVAEPGELRIAGSFAGALKAWLVDLLRSPFRK